VEQPRQREGLGRQYRKGAVAADPADAAAFKANAAAYSKKLDAMDAYAKAKFETIPADRRKVLTSHDAFGYFGREYMSASCRRSASRPRARRRPQTSPS
jgi:ABC-type Zn uptake system ZnuABC Zn-binding protein ZnuA